MIDTDFERYLDAATPRRLPSVTEQWLARTESVCNGGLPPSILDAPYVVPDNVYRRMLELIGKP